MTISEDMPECCHPGNNSWKMAISWWLPYAKSIFWYIKSMPEFCHCSMQPPFTPVPTFLFLLLCTFAWCSFLQVQYSTITCTVIEGHLTHCSATQISGRWNSNIQSKVYNIHCLFYSRQRLKLHPHCYLHGPCIAVRGLTNLISSSQSWRSGTMFWFIRTMLTHMNKLSPY